MTLALYGKSKQRQTGLILAGIIAVLLAVALGMGFAQWRNASAASTTIELHQFNVGTQDDIPNWSDTSGSDASVVSNVARLHDNAVMSRTISTAGFNSIDLEFACLGDTSNSDSDDLVVEYRLQDSGDWTLIDTLDTNESSGNECEDDNWEDQSYDLPAAVEDVSTFQLRFRAVNIGGTGENVYIDNIRVSGEPITIPAPLVQNPGFTQCQPADILLVLDSSGSIGSGLGTMKTNIIGAANAIEAAIPGTNWRAVSFRDPDNAAPAFTSSGTWQTTTGDITTLINGMVSDGYTPTAGGIDFLDGDLNGPLANIMIIITDGDPNVPIGGNAPPARYYLGGQSAVAAAETARGLGWNTVVVTFGPGDDSSPAAVTTATLAGLKGPNVEGPAGQVFAVADAAGLQDAIIDALLEDCLPDIEKKFVGLNLAGTEASWTVEIKNNSQTTQSFHLVEEVPATLYQTANCNNVLALPSSTTPPAEPGWLCEISSGVTATYYLTTPVTFNLCTGGNAVNDYYVRYTGPGSPFDGYLSVEVPGIPQACDREIIVDKNFVGLGGYVPDADDVPDLDLPDGVTIKSEGFLDADTYRWVLNAPINAGGEVTEVNIPDFWAQVSTKQCIIPDLTDTSSLLIQEQAIIEIPVADCVFENQPFGILVINKTDGTSDGSTLWDFTVQNLPEKAVDGTALDPNPQASENTPSQQSLIPLGSGALFVTEDDFRSETACATANTYFTSVIGPNPDQELTFPGDSVVWNFSNQPCGVLGTGGILIEKWEDVNGDGIISAGDQRLPGWTFTSMGTGIPVASEVQVTNASGQVLAHISGLEAGVVVETFETPQPGWVFVGTDVDGGPMTNDASPDVVIVGGKTIVVRFLNERARVNIVATKTIFNNANPAGANGGAGWTFTLTGCGIAPSLKVTDASGTVSWTNLPAAINCTYTVTETAKAGWVADDISKTAAPVNDGETVTVGFVNRQIQGCTNIADCPPPTISTATPTNTPTTPVTGETPTTPPTDPTATNTPDEDVEGEKTPGPGGQATPVAPDTGSGFGSTAAGWNMLLILAGLIAISGGLSMIAIGRRTVRND